MSDNELDSLFKEAADGFKAPQDTSAWHAMAKKLDQAGVTTSPFWNWKTISSVAVVGVTSVAVFWYLAKSDVSQKTAPGITSLTETTPEIISPKENSPETASVVEEQKSKEVASDTQENLRQRGKAQNETSALQVSDNNKLIKTKQEHAVEDVQQNPSFGDKNDPINSSVRESKVSAVGSGEIVRTAEFSVQQDPIGRSSNSLKESEITGVTFATIDANSSNQSAGPPSQSKVSSPAAADSVMKPVAEEPLAVTDNSLSEESESKPEEKKKESGDVLSLKLITGADFASINYYTPDKAGFNYGLLIGYSFNNRWSVYTGAISSRKIYASNEIDEPYTTSGGYPYEINELEGDCRVLDIPINFYYTFFPERSFSLKAGIGISSYLMLSEDYVYHVDNTSPYGSDVYNQNIDHENNEWFKMMNVSLTIQKKINNRFYLEFEPYLKAPLTGVGEGEVSLVSLGAFLNLRFDIPINKSVRNDE